MSAYLFFFLLQIQKSSLPRPYKLPKTIGKIKRLLIGLQNEQSVEIETTTSSESSISNNQSFDLWSYHTTVASLQIEYRTMPVDQEVKLYQHYNFSEF